MVVATLQTPYVSNMFPLRNWQLRYMTMISRAEDPELRRLADLLPQTVLKSRASSTTGKYLGAFKRWKQWASEHSINAFPTEEKYLALYLQHISESSQSITAAEHHVHALAWLNGEWSTLTNSHFLH